MLPKLSKDRAHTRLCYAHPMTNLRGIRAPRNSFYFVRIEFLNWPGHSDPVMESRKASGAKKTSTANHGGCVKCWLPGPLALLFINQTSFSSTTYLTCLLRHLITNCLQIKSEVQLFFPKITSIWIPLPSSGPVLEPIEHLRYSASPLGNRVT